MLLLSGSPCWSNTYISVPNCFWTTAFNKMDCMGQRCYCNCFCSLRKVFIVRNHTTLSDHNVCQSLPLYGWDYFLHRCSHNGNHRFKESWYQRTKFCRNSCQRHCLFYLDESISMFECIFLHLYLQFAYADQERLKYFMKISILFLIQNYCLSD